MYIYFLCKKPVDQKDFPQDPIFPEDLELKGEVKTLQNTDWSFRTTKVAASSLRILSTVYKYKTDLPCRYSYHG